MHDRRLTAKFSIHLSGKDDFMVFFAVDSLEVHIELESLTVFPQLRHSSGKADGEEAIAIVIV